MLWVSCYLIQKLWVRNVLCRKLKFIKFLPSPFPFWYVQKVIKFFYRILPFSAALMPRHFIISFHFLRVQHGLHTLYTGGNIPGDMLNWAKLKARLERAVRKTNTRRTLFQIHLSMEHGLFLLGFVAHQWFIQWFIVSFRIVGIHRICLADSSLS